MEGRKYILTNQTREYNTHILYRIRHATSGRYGGWVESEENLSQDGDCWIFDEGMVYENARVIGDALICDHARVCGSASVGGEAVISEAALVNDFAIVCGNATVTGGAHVGGYARIFGNAMVASAAEVMLGCIGDNGRIYMTDAYLVIGPIGFRNEIATFYNTKSGDIWVSCGYFNNSLEEFTKAVRAEYRPMIGHYEAFRDAIDYAIKKLR